MSTTTQLPAWTPRPRVAPRWADFLRVGPHAAAHHAAVRVGVSALVPLLTMTVIGRPAWTPWAVLVTTMSVYGRRASWSERMRVQTSVGLVQVVLIAGGTALSASGFGGWGVVAAGALVAGVCTILADLGRWTPPGCLFFVFTFGACAAAPANGGDIAVAAAVALCGATWTAIVTAMGSLLEYRGGAAERPPAGATGTRSSAPGRRLTVLHACLCLVAAGAAGSVAMAGGLQRPYWAMVAAIAPVVGPTTADQLLRAGHRFAGTCLGLLVAAALFWWSLGALGTVVLLGTLFLAAELMVARNYSLALLAITPLTIGMVHPSGHRGLVDLLIDRAAETTLGVAVVSVLILATHALRHPRIACALAPAEAPRPFARARTAPTQR